MLDHLRADLKYAGSWLARSPAFTSVAVASLAIGIGFNTALFSMIDALLLRALPVERPHEIVDVYTRGSDGDTYDKMKENVLDEAKRIFKPEFLNRINDIVVFHGLKRDHLVKIVELEIAQVAKRLAERKIALDVTPEAKDLLIDNGYDEKFGARPLRRAIERLLEDPLAEAILRGDVKDGEPVQVQRENDHLVFGQNTPLTNVS